MDLDQINEQMFNMFEQGQLDATKFFCGDKEIFNELMLQNMNLDAKDASGLFGIPRTQTKIGDEKLPVTEGNKRESYDPLSILNNEHAFENIFKTKPMDLKEMK